jgi:hypothetical protein
MISEHGKIDYELLNFCTDIKYEPLSFAAPPAFSLNIACIITDSLFQKIRHDANVFFLTPFNFQYVLRYGKIDFLLVESCIHSATGDWHYAQLAANELNTKMHKVVKLCSTLGIPSVFWSTESAFLSKNFKKLLEKFDYIYAADLNLGFKIDKSIDYLPEAIQPRLHNHFSTIGQKKINKKYIVDGLNEIKSFGHKELFDKYDLDVYDTTFFTLKKKVSNFKKIPQKSIKGHISERAFFLTVKNSSGYISFSDNSNSISRKRQLQIEAAASGTPVLRLGKLRTDDIRAGCIISCESFNELTNEVIRVKDSLYRLRRGHTAFRYLNNYHTIAHRLQKICKNIGNSGIWEEFPLATLACATNRSNKFEDIVSNFERQNYPNKELLIIYNGTDDIERSVRNQIQKHGNRHFFAVPKGYALGGALNCAVEAAKSKYIFKIDDDDYYCENYILDLILAVRFLDIDVFGKPQSNFFRFEGDDFLYLRLNNRGVNYLCKSTDQHITGKQIIIGNSIAAKTDFLKKQPFSNGLLNHTDSMFFYKLKDLKKGINMAICDPFNMIVERRENIKSHTWVETKEKILSKCESGYIFLDAIL